MATLELRIDEAWKQALDRWNSPSIPALIAPKTQEEVQGLGDIGRILQGEIAFMKYPEFQAYLNVQKVAEIVGEDVNRGALAVLEHEVGHRFCPYDPITMLLLNHAIKQELEGKSLPYDVDSASKLVLNLFTDMCINTKSARRSSEDIPWLYAQISSYKDERKEIGKLWKVYGRSMETAWKKKLLPDNTTLTDEQSRAAEELAGLFEGDFFDKTKWRLNARTYARIISDFLEDPEKDKKSALSDVSENMPKTLDEKTEKELAKRLAEIGSNGLPTNPAGLKEFKDILAGFGKGDPVQASIVFYDRLSDSYDVMFATRPFGRPRVNPFQPVKWNPSMGADQLDVNYSVQTGGRIIPSVTTQAWKTRRREAQGGLEEVVPDCDLYLDSSMSMPNPVETVSLPVLAGFVVAKKAHRKGAMIRSTNFSGKGQSATQDYTIDLQGIFRNLVTHYNGGTVFPVDKLVDGHYPKQVLVITDTFLCNENEVAEAITDLRKTHFGNRVAIYSINLVDHADYLRNAGAQVIHDTTTEIFRKAIGTADEVYSK